MPKLSQTQAMITEPYSRILSILKKLIPKGQSIKMANVRLICRYVAAEQERSYDDVLGNTIKFAEEAGFLIDENKMTRIDDMKVIRQFKNKSMWGMLCLLSGIVFTTFTAMVASTLI